MSESKKPPRRGIRTYSRDVPQTPIPPHGEMAIAVSAVKGPTLLSLARNRLHPDPNQPRRHFDPEALAELAESIRLIGIQHPITVKPLMKPQGHYMIEDGERRWRAAGMAGLAEVPCLLAGGADKEDDPAGRRARQLGINHAAQPNTPLEYAQVAADLFERVGSWAAVGEELARQGLVRSAEEWRELVRLLELPSWAKALVDAGSVTPPLAAELLKAPTLAHEALRDRVEGALGRGEALSRALVEEMVYEAAEAKAPKLSAQRFDLSDCAGCADKATLADAQGAAVDFCLRPECFATRADAAESRRLKAEMAREAERLREELLLLLADAEQLPTPVVAVPAADAAVPAPAETTEPAGGTARPGDGDIAELVVDWLRERIIAEALPTDAGLCLGLTCWAALSLPGSGRADQRAGAATLDEVLGADPQSTVRRAAELAVRTAAARDIWMLAGRLDLGVDGYRVTRDYCDRCSDEGLSALLTEVSPQEQPELIELLRRGPFPWHLADAIGCPPPVRALWEQRVGAG